MIIASFELKHYWYFGALIFGSFITLVIIARLWSRVFWKDQPKMETSEKFNYFYQLSSFDKMRFVLPIVLLTIVTLYIGFGAEHIQEISTRIAEEIVNKDLYINAVLKSS